VTVTSEAEIKDCMRTSLRGVIDDCGLLATLPIKGRTYSRMRDRLQTIENCCKQMAAWRDDTRWLPIGMMMEMAHQRSREWIAGRKINGLVVKGDPQCFLMLQTNLRALLAVVDGLADKATGRVGMILPEPLPAPHRETKPVQIIIPGETVH
jgi:hypothetical protein